MIYNITASSSLPILVALFSNSGKSVSCVPVGELRRGVSLPVLALVLPSPVIVSRRSMMGYDELLTVLLLGARGVVGTEDAGVDVADPEAK